MSVDGEPLGSHFARMARERGEEIALVAPDGARSWQELNSRANRLARGLAALGVATGDFVTVALPNACGFVEACVACWKLGAIPQPASPRMPVPELQAIVELARSRVVLVEPGAAAGALGVSPQEVMAGQRDGADLPEAVSPHAKAPTSGGSTGRPKLIVSGRPGRVELSGPTLFGISAGDVVLMPAPLYHNGPFSAAFAGLMAGAKLVLLAKFDAEETLRAIAREAVTWVYLVPTMMNRIWHLPDEVRGRHAVGTLRSVWHMAAPCPAWLKEAWIGWLGAETIHELYGGTEAQSVTVISGTEWLQHRGSVGRPYHGEMCIMGPDGTVLAAGETGEIYMRPSAGTPPTYRYIGAEARRLGDWESLGDMGWMDADGYLYIADRRSDMILVGGANVYPAEVEAALEEHPLVLSCAVVGLPDEDLGNIVHAVVQGLPGISAEALKTHLDARLSPPKRPRTYELVDHPVRDDAGKVRRSQLRADHLAAAGGAGA